MNWQSEIRQSGIGQSVIGLSIIGLSVIGAAQVPQVQDRPAQPAAVEEALRVRFNVTVTADQTVQARVLEYLQLIAVRNNLQTKFNTSASRSTMPELELVLLFERYPRMPGNRRDLGSVMLRIDTQGDAAGIEYCLRRCTEHNAELVVYRSTLDEFLRKLDTQSAILARRYR